MSDYLLDNQVGIRRWERRNAGRREHRVLAAVPLNMKPRDFMRRVGRLLALALGMRL